MNERGSVSVLIDGREFVAGRRTGIGRFLEGLLHAAVEAHGDWKLVILMTEDCSLPSSLAEKVDSIWVDSGELVFGRKCSQLSESADLFVSPYPKLPVQRLLCPAIHTVHDVFYLTHATYRKQRARTVMAKWLLKRSMAKASLTWFVSKASQQACEELVGDAINSAVRYSPVEASFTPIDPSDKSPSLDYFLCVGNGMPHKNVEVLMQAIAGTALRLKCVGVSEQARERIVASSPDVKGQVEFLQGVGDSHLIELYRNAIALLLPSLEEGYGFPPLEAMACGTPAIVSDIPVLRESTGDKASYCSPHDAEAWQREMLKMQQPEQHETLRQQALLWVRSRQGKRGWREHLNDMASLMGVE